MTGTDITDGTRVVALPSVREPIRSAVRLQWMGLGDHKLDLLGLCGFGCRFCSSNDARYLRMNRPAFAEATREQLGEPLLPATSPDLTFEWPDVIERLEAQLARKSKSWGRGWTLLFSMLTDGFSPRLVADGVTETALRLVLEKTSFRIRVLTRNAIVGNDEWIGFFTAHRDRFTVGLSTGSLDDQHARRMEIGTSPPSARIAALRRLQDAGVPTFAMLSPIFPDMLTGNRLKELIEAVRPQLVERVIAEPFNDRRNWMIVRDVYPPGSEERVWFDAVYGEGRRALWSQYATDLFLALHDHADREGWLVKLWFLLHEKWITQADAARIGTRPGIMFQDGPDVRDRIRNRHIAAIRA